MQHNHFSPLQRILLGQHMVPVLWQRKGKSTGSLFGVLNHAKAAAKCRKEGGCILCSWIMAVAKGQKESVLYMKPGLQ